MGFSPITTPEEVEDLVAARARENQYLEFKRKPHHLEPEQKERNKEAREVARDVTQFANTDGGVLLYGIQEVPGDSAKMKAASGVCPVKEPDKAEEWIAQSVANYAYPAPSVAEITGICLGGDRVVIAVNIRPSERLVGVWRASEPHAGMEFLYRNNHGKQWLTMDEVSARMSIDARAKKLRLQELLDLTAPSGRDVPVRIFHPVRQAASNPPIVTKPQWPCFAAAGV